MFTINEEETTKLEYALFNAVTKTFIENGSIDRKILEGDQETMNMVKGYATDK